VPSVEVGLLPSPLSAHKQSFGAILITRALMSSLDRSGRLTGARQPGSRTVGRRLPVGFVLTGSIPACLAPQRPRLWEGGMGTWRGDVAWSRRADGHKQW